MYTPTGLHDQSANQPQLSVLPEGTQERRAEWPRSGPGPRQRPQPLLRPREAGVRQEGLSDRHFPLRHPWLGFGSFWVNFLPSAICDIF